LDPRGLRDGDRHLHQCRAAGGDGGAPAGAHGVVSGRFTTETRRTRRRPLDEANGPRNSGLRALRASVVVGIGLADGAPLNLGIKRKGPVSIPWGWNWGQDGRKVPMVRVFTASLIALLVVRAGVAQDSKPEDEFRKAL